MRQKTSSSGKSAFTANYNGEPIKVGEVMVPFPCSDLDAENCINKECLRTVYQGGKGFRVIYRAVPEAWAKTARSALNLVQNEGLGHYNVPNSVSRDGACDEYGLEFGTAPSAEEAVLEQDGLGEALAIFIGLVRSLIEKNPMLGCAVMLVYTDVKGKAFYSRMHLTYGKAKLIRQQAESVLESGLANFDVESITCCHSKNDAVYRQEALKLLNQAMELYR